MNKKIITRFAPSPTGFMHLGNLRTALYAWLLARKAGGNFTLRIEDTDRTRYVEGATEVIFDTLKECGLTWDGDVHVQSERVKSGIYMKHALELVEKGFAYRCICTPDDIVKKIESEAINNKYITYDCPCINLSEIENEKLKNNKYCVIRQKTPVDGSSSFNDEIFGTITIENKEIEDQVLIKSDGMPTYNFANVIDDHDMGINLVVRGNEYLSSTPKYNLLYEAFGWEIPTYIHCPQIMRDANHKLSKRDGDAYFSDFKDKGYLTQAIINYIALLGWSPKSENEIFTLGELVNEFGIDGISKSPAIFDEVKMRAINANHIRNLAPEKFKELAVPFIGNFNIDYDVLCAALQPRTEVLTDISSQVDFLHKPCEYEIELYNNKKMKTTPETALTALKSNVWDLNDSDFSRDNIYNILEAEAAKHERKIGYYLYPLQVALTGKKSAPGGGLDICVILGKEESTRRIKAAVAKLEGSL